MSPDSYQPPEFEPYRPPWYPHDDNPQTIVLVASGDVVTKYARWTRSLPDGELLRRIHEWQRARREGLAYDRQAGRVVEEEAS